MLSPCPRLQSSAFALPCPCVRPLLFSTVSPCDEKSWTTFKQNPVYFICVQSLCAQGFIVMETIDKPTHSSIRLIQKACSPSYMCVYCDYDFVLLENTQQKNCTTKMPRKIFSPQLTGKLNSNADFLYL